MTYRFWSNDFQTVCAVLLTSKTQRLQPIRVNVQLYSQHLKKKKKETEKVTDMHRYAVMRPQHCSWMSFWN